MSDASGVSYDTLYRIHMFPEVSDSTRLVLSMRIPFLTCLSQLIQAACSMFGAWGKAIKNTNGTLYQLRALDWDTNGPFQLVRSLVYYFQASLRTKVTETHNGADARGAGLSPQPWRWPHVCHFWMGRLHCYDLGLLISSHGCLREGLGRLQRYHEPHRCALALPSARYHAGTGLVTLERTQLIVYHSQYDQDIDDAIMRMEAASRTCAIFVGLGDYTNTFTAFGYTHDKLVIQLHNITTCFCVLNRSSHSTSGIGRTSPCTLITQKWRVSFTLTSIPSLPFTPASRPSSRSTTVTSLRRQPSSTSLLRAKLVPSSWLWAARLGDTYPSPMIGDMQVAVYDYASDHVYLANAGPAPNAVPAYKRPFIRLNMAKLFAEPKP